MLNIQTKQSLISSSNETRIQFLSNFYDLSSCNLLQTSNILAAVFTQGLNKRERETEQTNMRHILIKKGKTERETFSNECEKGTFILRLVEWMEARSRCKYFVAKCSHRKLTDFIRLAARSKETSARTRSFNCILY